MISLINTGKRLDNIVSYIKNQSPQDTWIIDSIVPLFLEAINQNLSPQEEKLVISKVNQLIDSYEFRYGKIFENNSLITEVSDETLDLQQKFFNDMLVNKSKIVQRYGKDAEKVMKGKAMNLAKKETEKMNKQKLKELVRKTLTMDEVEENKVFAPGELDFSSYITDEQKMIARAFMVDPSKTMFKNNTVIFTPPISVELNDGSTVMLGSVKMGNRFGFIKGYFDETGNEIPSISIKMPSKYKMGEGKKADKDYDGDGEVESSEEEYKGVKDKAIKKAMAKKEVKEGYYGTTNVESYLEAIGYESFEDFFENNPGGEDALMNWIESVPEFRQSLEGAGLLSEDLDLGHEDNEPHMIKGELYKIGKYAMELYQMVDSFEGKGEVDFPAWWQAKITKACSMIGSAKHYLEFELKEPAIDAAVDALTGEEPHIGEPEASMMNEDEGAILDQVRNKLLGLFQPYGDFQILDMTMKGQNTGENFRLRAKSKGADWKGLENFMRNNPDFNIKHISKQTFDNPKTIDFSYKTSMMNEDEIGKDEILAGRLYKIKNFVQPAFYQKVRSLINSGDLETAELFISRMEPAAAKNDMEMAKMMGDLEDIDKVAAQRQREKQMANIFTEKKLTKAEKSKKEDIVKGMKKSFKGDESAMYAIATAKAKKVAETITKKLKEGTGLKKGDTVEFEGKKYKIGSFDTEANLVYLNTMDNKPAEDSKGSYLKVHATKVKKTN